MSLNWYAARVAPQFEIRVQTHFNQREHPTLVPLEKRTRWRERKGKKPMVVTRNAPILPGYVFVGLSDYSEFRAAKDSLLRIIERPLVYGLVGFGKPAVIAPVDLLTLRGLAGVAESNPEIKPFRAGEQARLTEGPWRGHVVPVVSDARRRGGEERVKVLLGALNSMPVATDVPTSMLERVA